MAVSWIGEASEGSSITGEFLSYLERNNSRLINTANSLMTSQMFYRQSGDNKNCLDNTDNIEG